MIHSYLTRRDLIGLSAIGFVIGPAHALQVRAQADPRDLLESAAAAMADLTSFHFEIETIDGRSTILENLELTKVVGDVLRPASLQATMTAKVAVISINVDVISIDGNVWVTNPLAVGTEWQQVAVAGEESGGASSFTNLINPDQLFLLAIGLMDDPQIDGEDEIDGIPTTVVSGSFDPAKLQDLASPVAGETDEFEQMGLLTGEPVYLTAWIAEDGRVIRIEEEGPLIESESDDVIRQINFSAFNDPVEILPPEVE